MIVHNLGIPSRQLCNTLGVLLPNLVSMMNQLEKCGRIIKRPHPNDGRARP